MNRKTAAGIALVIVLAAGALLSVPFWDGYGRPAGTGACAVPVYGFTVVSVHPHDPTAFTEGLVYNRDDLYESTGLHGNSSVRRVDVSTGKVLRSYRLPDGYFGESLTVWNDSLVQLTWKSRRGFVYTKSGLEPARTLTYRGEGWGITGNGTSLITGNGSDTLDFRNPGTFATERSLTVTDCGRPVPGLNELEFVNGSILANVYPGDLIAVISPESGSVTGWIDLRQLTAGEKRSGSADVLNGIKYNPQNGTLLVTGKYWPDLFEIELQRDGSTVRI